MLCSVQPSILEALVFTLIILFLVLPYRVSRSVFVFVCVVCAQMCVNTQNVCVCVCAL